MSSHSMSELVQVIKRVAKTELDDAKRPPVTNEEVAEILAFSASPDPVVLATLLEAFGDLGRREVNRRTLTENGVPECAVPLLTHPSEDVQLFAVRALANLCFDSGASSADAGRMKVESLGGIPVIVDMLKNVKNTKRLRMVLGCIGNLASNTEHLAVAMEAAIPTLSDCLLHPQTDISSMAALALGNMLVTSELKIAGLKVGVFDRLVAKLAKPDSDICQILTALGALCDTKPLADQLFDVHNGFNKIFELIRLYEHPEVDDEDERLDIEEEADAILKATFNFLVDLANIDDEFRGIFLKQVGVIETLLKFSRSSNLVVAEESSHVLSTLTLSDEANRVLLAHADVFLGWLQRGDSSELRNSAAMVLGNLAQDDASTTQLLEKGVAQALIQELARGLDGILTRGDSENVVEAAQNSEREGKEMRIKHLCASGLKNYAVNPLHKKLLLKLNVMPLLVELLKQQKNDIVRHAAIVLIRSLFVVGQDAIDQYLAGDPHALLLLSMTYRDEENKLDDHIFYEASRLVGSLVMFSIAANEETSSSSASSAPPSLSPALSRLLEFYHTEKLPKPVSIYNAVANLLRSKFTVLQAEAAAVLLQLIQLDPNAALSIISIPGLVKHILELLKLHLTDGTNEEVLRKTERDVATFPHLSLLLLLLVSHKDPKARDELLHSEPDLKQWIEDVSKGSRSHGDKEAAFLIDLRHSL